MSGAKTPTQRRLRRFRRRMRVHFHAFTRLAVLALCALLGGASLGAAVGHWTESDVNAPRIVRTHSPKYGPVASVAIPPAPHCGGRGCAEAGARAPPAKAVRAGEGAAGRAGHTGGTARAGPRKIRTEPGRGGPRCLAPSRRDDGCGARHAGDRHRDRRYGARPQPLDARGGAQRAVDLVVSALRARPPGADGRGACRRSRIAGASADGADGPRKPRPRRADDRHAGGGDHDPRFGDPSIASRSRSGSTIIWAAASRAIRARCGRS